MLALPTVSFIDLKQQIKTGATQKAPPTSRPKTILDERRSRPAHRVRPEAHAAQRCLGPSFQRWVRVITYRDEQNAVTSDGRHLTS
jgi:hypothetical protein